MVWEVFKNSFATNIRLKRFITEVSNKWKVSYSCYETNVKVENKMVSKITDKSEDESICFDISYSLNERLQENDWKEFSQKQNHRNYK